MNINSPSSEHDFRSHVLSHRLPLKTLAAAVCSVLGMGMTVQVAATTIVKDGKTATTVSQTAGTAGSAVIDVTTATKNASGKTAFNSFSDFTLSAGDTVNLHLPDNATSNLVNLVWDSQTVINGTLNSYLADGRTIGGNVFFADPNGIVVGSAGVLNVGALSLSAPTTSFMSTLLDAGGKVDTTSAAFTTLLQGQEASARAPSDGSCLICVDGKINANNAVRIRATAIDVSGTIFVAGKGTGTLATAVNVEGQSTPRIVMDGNTIRLVAEDSASASIGDAVADTSITVSGKLQTASQAAPTPTAPTAASWGLIQATASSATKAAYAAPTDANGPVTLLTQQAGSLLQDQQSFFGNGLSSALTDVNLAAADKLGEMAYVRAYSTANVDISGIIDAAGDVKLGASSTTEASTAATSRAGGKAAPVMVAAMYGSVFSKANTHITSAASVTAGGALTLASQTDNALEVSASTVAGSRTLASTVAWSQAAVSSDATVDGAVSAQSLSVTAHNSNSFSTAAETQTGASNGAIGVAGAISLQTVHANAELNSSPTLLSSGTGNVSVLAASETSKNSTSAKTGTEAPDTASSKDDTESNADLSESLANKSNQGVNGDGADADSKDGLPFHLGAAVSYTKASNTSHAGIGDGVIIDTSGDVAVYSNVTDAGVHNGAISAAVSKASEGGTSSGAGTKVDVAAAVSYASYLHQSSATIGEDASITAAHVGVGSDVKMPFDWQFGLGANTSDIQNMFGSLDSFITGAGALKSLSGVSASDIANGLSGYASASAGGSSPVAVGGSVNYFAVHNSNRAWVGDGTSLTSTATAATTPGQDAWQSSLDWNASPIDWAHSLTIQAETEVEAFNMVGDITPWKISTSGTKAAVGGAFNYAGYDNDTVAGIGKGAVINSHNDVQVKAISKDTLVALSPISGKGGTASLQGTVAITDVDDSTHATVSGGVSMHANALTIAAENPLMVWSLSGAIAMSNEASVGLSVGVNNLNTDTLALIGDNSADDDGSTTTTQSGGVFTLSSLDLLSHSTGESGALAVAGSSVKSAQSGGSGSSGSGSASGDESGSGLLDLVGNIASVTGKLQAGLGAVDTIGGTVGGSSGDGSMLSEAGDVLGQISDAASGVQSAGNGLSKVLDKASSLGKSGGGSGTTASPTSSGSFGIGVSGAASVNLATLHSKAEVSGVTVQHPDGDVSVTVQGINEAALTSMAGAGALQRSKASSFSGAIAGAVAYSSVSNDTQATISNSALHQANAVAVRALNADLQVDVAIGMGVNTSNSTSTTIAGSVSLAHSANVTLASIDGGSTLDGGTGSDSSLEVTAYDHSRIGVGGGSLYVNKSSGSSGNVGIGFTYADIANTTSASLSGHGASVGSHDIANYDSLALQALDSSLIGSGALAGGYSGSQSSASLAGAIVWNQIANSTSASIDGGMDIDVGGDILVQASAVAPVAALDALIDQPTVDGYDFTGSLLGSPDSVPAGGSTPGSSSDPAQPGAADLSLGDSGLGSSIVAVAGTVQVGGNNVGISYAGNQVSNTHAVNIENASIHSGGALSLAAKDDTRIVSLAVGLGVSSGQFAGLGSATSNTVANHDSILLGSAVPTGSDGSTPGGAVDITAASFDAQSADNTSIYSLAGNVAIGKGQAAAGGAITYNDIANSVTTHAGATSIDTGMGAITAHATENALIMAGAVAGTAATSGSALSLSFGWNQTADSANASFDSNSLLQAGLLDVRASNSADIYALSGSVAIGGAAAVGLAGVVADIGDSTTASVQNSALDIGASGGTGAVTIEATGTGTQYALAIAGAVGSDGAGVAGSTTVNQIRSDVTAKASQLYGVNSSGVADASAAAAASSLAVIASNNAAIYSLAGGIGIGSSVGVGAAATIAQISGATSASLSGSVLDISDSTRVSASSGAIVDTASVAGAAASSVAVSASDTTNLIDNSITATMSNVGTANALGSSVGGSNQTSVTATNSAAINALAGAVAGAGSAAVGAAVAVNHIGTQTHAAFLGGADHRTYKAANLTVSAGADNPDATTGGNAANINAIAVGAAGGGSVGVAGSVAVNLLSGGTDARIDQGANIIASDNVGVLASNNQGINVLAGAAALGGSAGVGVGVVVNVVDSNTSAGIYSSAVSAYGNGDALMVDSGEAAHREELDGSINILDKDDQPALVSDPANYAAPDLSGIQVGVHGVSVNAANQQHIATLGMGISGAGAAAINAMGGVNVVGGSTTATIQDATINQADRSVYGGPSDPDQPSSGEGVLYDYAQSGQQVDVRASSRQFEANVVASVAGAGGVAAAGALATNIFDATTTASIVATTLTAQAGSVVAASGSQWSLASAVGASASGSVAGAASGVVTMFNAHTDALVDGGTFDVGTFDVLANNATTGAQIGGAAGFGGGVAGIAGVALVNVDNVETSATVQNHALVNSSGEATVQANSSNSAQGVAVGAAAGLYAGIAGGAVVNVIGNSTHASIADSTVTASSLAVRALDSQSVNAFSGVFGGGLAGIGGGINLSLLQASVGAGLLNSDVTATQGGVTVEASSTRDVDSRVASVGAGAVGVGLSAGVVVAGSGDISNGGSASSQDDLNASGQVNLGNLSSLSGGNRVDSDTSNYGLSSDQLSSTDVTNINSNASYDLDQATGSGSSAAFGASDGVQASISGGSVDAQGAVQVKANVLNNTSNIAGAGAVGGVAVGASLAYTTLNSDIRASVDGDATVRAGNGISIIAGSGDGLNADGSSGHAAYTKALAGAAGVVGASAAVAISHVSNKVTASNAGTLGTLTANQGVLQISATDSSSAQAGNANATGLNVGGIVAGAVVVDASRSSVVNASIADGSAVGTSSAQFAAVNVSAADSGAVGAQGVMGSGGLLAAGSAVVALASDNSHVTASIGSHASVAALSTHVDASASPLVEATATGITVAGAAAIGANTAHASMNAVVRALVGDQASFGIGNLAVTAEATPTVDATTSGGSGALLLGANAATSTASDDASVLASIGNGVALPTGDVAIAATSNTHQSASATGITVGGLLAAGAATAVATSGVTTIAQLGNGNGSTAATLGNLSVLALGTDTNDADSMAGSGGLVSGNAAYSKTQSISHTTATIGQNLKLDQLSNFALSATHHAVYGGQSNSVNAAAVGASGANVENIASSTTLAGIGSGSSVSTRGDLRVEAQSTFDDDDNNGGASGGAGGILAGMAAGVSTKLTASNTTQVGPNATLAAGLNTAASRLGDLTLLADTRINGILDQSSLSVYGAVPVATAVVKFTGAFNSALNVGNGSRLSSNGRIDLATYASLQAIATQATANTAGVGTMGSAHATINLTSDQSVDIGNDVAILGIGEIDIEAGKDILNGGGTELNASSVAQAYVRGLIAIPDASATANTISHATLNLGTGSTVIGGGDVAIGSMPGTAMVQVDGTGHGYELGFIPVTQHGNHQSSSSSGVTTLNGSVLAGKFSKIDITIAADGTLSDGGSTAPYEYVKYNADCSSSNGAQNSCLNPTSYLNTFNSAPSGTLYQGFDDANVGAFIFGGSLAQKSGIIYGNDMLVSGGNVYLDGSTITGTGSVTANGAPSITINNYSSDYLILSGMQASFGNSGSVIVAGGADSGSLGGINVTQAPSGAQPSITVNSSFPALSGYTPGIVFLNEVNNLGGSLTVNNAAGSLIESSFHVNSQTITVPNGSVSFDRPNENWFSGPDPIGSLGTSGSWLTGLLGELSNADTTAAAIANSQYGAGATDAATLNAMLLRTDLASNPDAQFTPIILYGYCAAYTSADGCSSGGSYVLDDRLTPSVGYVALSRNGKFGDATAPGTSQSQTLSVKANFINIDSPLYVGTQATWTVETTPALLDWIALHDSGTTLKIPQYDSMGNALLKVVDSAGNSQLIGASYNPANGGQILLDNINASGGGQALFDGKIVSSGQGSIHVNSGFGSVLVDNTSGVKLVVNNVFAGSGGLGLITLVDRLQPQADGTPLTTWYVSENGQAAQQYDNANGATNWQTAHLVGAVDAGTTYQPLLGEEYIWSASTSVQRGDHASNWGWGTIGAGTAGQHWSLGNSGFVNSGDIGWQDLAGDDYVVNLSGHFTQSTASRVWYHGCDDGLGSECNYGTAATAYSATQDSWHSEWKYIYPTEGTLSLDVAQRADNPIGIFFATSQSNQVAINSNADILLNGLLSNTHAPSNSGEPGTLLSATNGGSILQNSKNALIWAHDVKMVTQGGGSIGTATDAVQTRIVHDSSPGSNFVAITDGGTIHASIDSGNGDQAIQALAAGDYGYGNVSIDSTGSLLGIAGNSRDVVGRDVSLVSTLGAIGSFASPLNIETHSSALYNGAIYGGTLNAHARSDIALNDLGGDTWVGSIVSDVGDVQLTVPNGGIYDSRLLTPASTLSSAQAQAIWSKLHLTDGEAAQGIVSSLQHQVDASYTQYWQMLNVGSVSAGQYTLNANAVALYWPLAAAFNGIDPASVTDPAQQASLTQAYVSQRYQDITGVFTTYLGSNWIAGSKFVTPQSSLNFTIDPNSTFYTDLVSNSTWTEDQLRYAINVAALSTPSGGQVGTVAPNISAHNITLVAGNGGIGRNAAALSIDYQEFKDLYETGVASSALQQDVLALGMANAPGDVVLLDAAGGVLHSTDPGFAGKLSTISLAQTNPLYLAATGKLNGAASGSAYVQANGDLHLAGFSAGTDIRMAATGSIEAAAGSSTGVAVLTSGHDLVLTAGSGHVSFGNGTDATHPGDALSVQVGGTLLSGSAATDLLLRQTSGNLLFGTAFANGLVSLSAPTGSILGILDSLSISGNDIQLDAAGDIAGPLISGGSNGPLQVQVGSAGKLDATAGGAINLESAQFALHVGTVHSGGQLTLIALKAGLDATQLISDRSTVVASAGADGRFDKVQAATGVTLSAAGRLDAGSLNTATGDIAMYAATGMSLQSARANDGNIVAQLVGNAAPQFLLDAHGSMQASGNIQVDSGGTLLMDTESTIDAGGTVSLTSKGDMQLGTVTSTATVGDVIVIVIDSNGAISSNGAAVNLQARQGGAVSLHSANDIGSQASPLTVDVDTLSGSSTSGDVWIHALGNISVPSFSVSLGDLTIAADQTLAYATLTAGGAAALSANQLDGGLLSAGTTAGIDSVGATTLDTVVTGSDLLVHAGTTLNATTLNVGGEGNLSSGDTMTLGKVSVVNDLLATAGADLVGATLSSTQGNATLKATGNLDVTGSLATAKDATLHSGKDTDLAALTVGGALAQTSTGNAHLGHGNVTGTSQFDTGGSLSVDQLEAGSDVTAQSGTDINLDQVVLSGGSIEAVASNALHVTTLLDVQAGEARLTSTGDMTLAQVRTSGDLTGNAGSNLAATTLDVGGEGILTSGDTMTLGRVSVVNDLLATAGADLVGATLSSTQGNATLKATGNLEVTGSLVTAKDATLHSGKDTDLAALTVGGALAQTSTGNAHLGHGTVTGTSQFDTGGSLSVDQLEAGSDVTAQSGTDMNLDQVVLSGGSIEAVAGNALHVNSLLNVQAGEARLTSTGDMTLAQVRTSGDLTGNAGSNLDATSLDVGGDGILTSGDTMTLGHVTVVNDLLATAGADLVGATLSSTQGNATLKATGNLEVTGSLATAKDATLHSGKDTDLAVLTVGGALAQTSTGNAHLGHGNVTGTSQFDTGGSLSVDQLEAGSDVTAQSGTDMNLDQVVLSGGSIEAVAGNALHVNSLLDVQAGEATLTSTGDMTLAQVRTSGDLTGNAGSNLDATSLDVGGDGILTSGDTMTLGQARTSSSLVAQAGGDLTATTLQVGTDGTLSSDAAISLLGAVTAGHNLEMHATDHLGFASVAAGTNVFGQSLTDSIDGDTVGAGGSIRFVAARDIRIGTQHAGVDIELQAGGKVATHRIDAGHDALITAGSDVDMYSTHAGNLVSVDSGGTLTVHDVDAGHAIGLAAKRMTFASLTAPDSINLLAREGDIIGSTLTTRDAYAAANGDIALDAAYIGNRINLAANHIDAHIKQTSTGQPLYSVLSGYDGGVARRITVDSDASQQWMIDRLSAVQAALATTAPRADIESGHIEQTMSLNTSMASLRMNQQSAELVPADVQFMQPTYDFLLYQDGIHTFSDAFVVRYGFGYQIQTPNYVDVHSWLGPDYLGESALIYNGRMLDQHTRIHASVPDRRAIPHWIHGDDQKLVQPVGGRVAVNLKAPD